MKKVSQEQKSFLTRSDHIQPLFTEKRSEIPIDNGRDTSWARKFFKNKSIKDHFLYIWHLYYVPQAVQTYFSTFSTSEIGVKHWNLTDLYEKNEKES